MREIIISVQQDYLNRITSVKEPIYAIIELIWNSFDADATEIKVSLKENKLGALDEIVIQDNGHGIEFKEAESVFGCLGGSWKSESKISKNKKRYLHGEAGKGRFMSFALGQDVEWVSLYLSNGSVKRFKITGSISNLKQFCLHDEEDVNSNEIGTTVKITNILKNFYSLRPEKSINKLTAVISPYMIQYPDTKVNYDGRIVNPDEVIKYKEEYKLQSIIYDNICIDDASLFVIEWDFSVNRSLYLCDSNGFALSEVPPGIHAKGFDFTAYLKTEYFRDLERDNSLLPDFDNGAQLLINEAKAKLKEHFRKRESQLVVNLVEEWKNQNIYPYEGEPADILETTEREVFDICASNLYEYMPDFNEFDIKNKKLTFLLLKQALDSPPALQKILEDVLELPPERQEELAELLKKTSLSAIINASKIVADRIEFLRGLDLLVFGSESRETLLERSQLHKILESQTWIFGEEFHLTFSDQSLTEVLKKHVKLLGRDDIDSDQPVTREDGKRGIVDLMLSKSISHPNAEEREHLIIELKRPKCNIDSKVEQQIRNYAFAVAADERFYDLQTKWNFIVVSNKISESVERMSNQKNRPKGLLFEDGNIYIWVKTWSQIINSSKGRMNFFQEKLKYAADSDSALEYLRDVHGKHLPKCMKES